MSGTPRQIEPEEVGRFGLDEENRLYWDGKLVHTETELTLSKPAKRLAKVVAWATIAAACGTLANAVASWTTYVMRRPVAVQGASPPTDVPQGPAAPPAR